MAQTLDEFLKEVKEDLVEFEKWWRKKNSENPEQFPMEMTTGNEGLFPVTGLSRIPLPLFSLG